VTVMRYGALDVIFTRIPLRLEVNLSNMYGAGNVRINVTVRRLPETIAEVEKQ